MPSSIPDYPIHHLIARRYSPFAFESRAVADNDLLAVLEAARWSASAANAQPWSYIVAKRDDAGEFAQMLTCVDAPHIARFIGQWKISNATCTTHTP
jgi:nitroreductase